MDGRGEIWTGAARFPLPDEGFSRRSAALGGRKAKSSDGVIEGGIERIEPCRTDGASEIKALEREQPDPVQT